MALKDLLVVLDQSEDSFPCLDAAAALAALHGSRLTGLFVREWTAAQQQHQKHSELGLASAAAMQASDRRVEEAIEGVALRLRSALAGHGRERGLVTEWSHRDGPASRVVPGLARHFDLCLVRANAPESLAENLVLEAARPIVIVPPMPNFESLGRHIAIAWNGSRAATRALNDALPLIERAERATVLVADGGERTADGMTVPLEHIAEHIRRHTPTVDLVRIGHRPGQSVAEALQHEARQAGASLLVAGAFGHSQLRESILGGVTRGLFDAMKMPVLLSH
jgi:nucleotide-binding universal stress UspA family protein